MYANNERWNPEPCRTCVCETGSVFCEDVLCEDTSQCRSVEIPVGQCCPVCSDAATTPSAEDNTGEHDSSHLLNAFSFILQ
jgi:hypothetical protein